MVTINTHKGLYKYKRLPFEVASSPTIFQRTMEATLQGLLMVCVYLDNLLMSGKTQQEHLTNLNEVMACLKSAGLCHKEKSPHFANQKSLI